MDLKWKLGRVHWRGVKGWIAVVSVWFKGLGF